MRERSPSRHRPLERDDLVRYLDTYLGAGDGPDYGPNGLQVEGKPVIQKLVTGVSASRELFLRAEEAGADAVLVHHGLFWEGSARVLTGVQFRRVAELIRADLNLIAYHLPLDRHPEVGNNAVAARAFGLVEVEPFAEHEGLPLGVQGRFPEPIRAADFLKSCRRIFDQEPIAFPFGPDPLSSLGIVSGAAEKDFHRAIAGGLDAFVTGEASEWVMSVAREAGRHFVAAGHYATERLGVRALGEHLAERFGIAVEFIDVPNPV